MRSAFSGFLLKLLNERIEMADKVTPDIRTRTMRGVKSKDSKMEVKFRSALWRSGLRFYKNAKNLPGKPDIVFPKLKIVVFLDSCYWHGCPLHLRMPKSNLDYWLPKIERNKKRDNEINVYYTENGWRIFRIWEHELKTDFDSQVLKISETVRNRQNYEQRD